MICRTGLSGLLVILLVSACNSQQQDSVQTQLDSVRVMVKQSALLAVQAVCAGSDDVRQEMVQASVTMLRRAMGGSEMAKIHKMMELMPDMGNAGVQGPMKEPSADMQMHVAVHDAGENLYDFLDGLSQPGFDCRGVSSVQLAATAALMREQQGPKVAAISVKLDAEAESLLNPDVPPQIRVLVLALQRI